VQIRSFLLKEAVLKQQITPHFEIAPCDTGFTLRESLTGQLMHSQVGPWTEALAVYIEPSEFENRVWADRDKKAVQPLVIYDIGMGIAANALAAMEKYRAIAQSSGSSIDSSGRLLRPLQIISFEKYPEALTQVAREESTFEFLKPYRSEITSLIENGSVMIPISSGTVSWSLLRGDFLELDLSEVPAPELIYFDFYSPASCPELWTRSVFEKIHERCKQQLVSPCKLLTYACGKSVRSAMLLAGFYVGAGPSTAMKLETTEATLNFSELKNPLGREWLKSLERSEKPLPIDVPGERYAEVLAELTQHQQFQ
jgi:queuine tRNA-ribosyltransferase